MSSSRLVGSRIKEMLLGMKRYLNKINLITWSLDKFKFCLESIEKVGIRTFQKENNAGEKQQESPPKIEVKTNSTYQILAVKGSIKT
ncbi:unnamed protein product [Paramecium primaurelia]|uniref:Uncharacterized protein n=1 Tax=Paramecium primaurelia TaxID=5886 RepID=A0A8S1KI01_PARPR|nr:unnamed protein product [Paramecium primaurelia]